MKNQEQNKEIIMWEDTPNYKPSKETICVKCFYHKLVEKFFMGQKIKYHLCTHLKVAPREKNYVTGEFSKQPEILCQTFNKKGKCPYYKEKHE